MLATVEPVLSVSPHPNGDRLEIVHVRGWDCAVTKGKFVKDQKVVFIQVDTIVPLDREPFAGIAKFLPKGRVRPSRIRSVLSYGLVFSLAECGLPEDTAIGAEVAEALGVRKYEKPLSPQLAGNAEGARPSWIIKTDEENLRNYPDAVAELIGKTVYVTLKMDGTSASYGIDEKGDFVVCSRNLQIKDGDNAYWNMARKYDIEAKLKAYAEEAHVHGHSAGLRNFYIQGEIYGPGIQGNPTGATELQFAMFNNHWGLNLPGVPTVEQLVVTDVGQSTDPKELFSYLKFVANEQVYENGKPAEGIVIRTSSVRPSRCRMCGGDTTKPWSFKLINENYKEFDQ